MKKTLAVENVKHREDIIEKAGCQQVLGRQPVIAYCL